MYLFQLNLAWKTRLRFLLAFTTLTLSSTPLPSLGFTCVYFKLFPFVALTTFLSNWSLPLSLLLLDLRLYVPNYLCTHIYSCLFSAYISMCTRFPRVYLYVCMYLCLCVCTFFPTVICLLLSPSLSLSLSLAQHICGDD